MYMDSDNSRLSLLWGEGRTCLHLVLFMVQFGVKCWEVSLETALEHFNYTFPACCYIFPEFWTSADFFLPMF